MIDNFCFIAASEILEQTRQPLGIAEINNKLIVHKLVYLY